MIRTDFPEIFFEQVKQCEKSIYLCTPFVKKNIISAIYEQKNPSVQMEVITNFNFSNFYRGAIDIQAMMQILSNGDALYNHQLLQGNMYVFDEQKVIITSSCLTDISFYQTTERGLLVEDETIVQEACVDFKRLCTCDPTTRVNMETVSQLQTICNDLWKKGCEPTEDVWLREEAARLFEGDLEKVKMHLTEWQKTVLNVIERTKKKQFKMKEITAHEKLFQSLFPKNYTILTTIKRTLKELRNLGLIQYLGKDNYRVLWW